MIILFILSLSILLQFVAAFLAFRLNRLTGRQAAWTLISTAIVLMAIRRSITFFQLISDGIPECSSIFSSELVALLISCLMLAGLALIGRLFLSIKHSEEVSRESKEKYKKLMEIAQKEITKKERLSTLGYLTATISHELRNPLGTLENTLFAIGEKVGGKATGVDRLIERAERNITRCNGIIEELLEYTRSSSPNLKLEPMDVDDWLGKFLDKQPRLNGISLKRKLSSGVKISLDREKFSRAVINVIENACQAMEESENGAEKNYLTVQSAVSKDRLEVRIKDNGFGISPEELENVFEPLYSTKNFGVGLGLPIANQILKQHGGGVGINSKPGKGTTVTLWLPISNQT